MDFEPIWRRAAERAHRKHVDSQLEPPVWVDAPRKIVVAVKPLKTHCHRGHDRLEPGAIIGEYICRQCEALRKEAMKLARRIAKEKQSAY